MMGSHDKPQKWHVYTAAADSAAVMTENSGIRKILPNSEICDFEFDPCGYSMNAIEEDAISTIHVTPEDGFSYASFEAMGYNLNDDSLTQMLERVLDCFQPAHFSVALHADSEECGSPRSILKWRENEEEEQVLKKK
ncbi:unnamed protein product, partial [Vitis vinifera]